jgi:glycerophosphoryl diester phosphodiesterase
MKGMVRYRMLADCRWWVLGFVLFFCAGTIDVSAQRAEDLRRKLLDPEGEVLVAAHRAAHAKYPENSLDAIREAIRLKVDIIEIDVKVSKDGVPFLMHDRTMDRTTNGKGDPEEFTWEELQGLAIVEKGKVTRLKIPSLEQALNEAHGKILVDLDLKTDRLDDLFRIVEKTSMQDYVLFFDSDYNVLQRVQKKSRNFMIMPRVYNAAQADSAVMLFDPPVVHIDFDCYTDETVDIIKGSMARIWINALGDPDVDIRNGKPKKALKKLLEKRASIVQTDEPALLLEALHKNTLAVERVR